MDSSLISNLQEDVKCFLCKDTLNEPKITKCCHTFCKPCIKRHADPIEEVDVFKCPKCRVETLLPKLNNVEDLKTSLLHSRKLEVLALLKGETACCVSENHPPASWYCFDRNNSMCDDCKDRHSTLNGDHNELVSLKALTLDNLDRMLKRENLCQDHNQIYEFYCKDCKICICVYCFRDKQCLVHDKVRLKDEAVQKCLMKENVDLLKKKEEEVMKQVETLKEITIKTKQDSERAKQEVKETVERLSALVRENERQLVKEIDQRLEKAEQQEKKGQGKLDRVRRAFDYYSNQIENGVVSEIIKAVKDNHADRSTDIPNIQDSRFKFALSNDCNKLNQSKHALGTLKQADHNVSIKVDSEQDS